jgi:2-iminoacetate synthase
LRRLGVGVLLGLHDWRSEAICLALHADYLMKRFWQAQVSISFPRLRHTPDTFTAPHPVSDAELVQLMLALRIFLPDAGMVLSTREPATLRDRLIPLGITQMSAGSRTEPGGYLHPAEEGGQFSVEDQRSPLEVAEVIRRGGYEPVWKDWDHQMHENSPGVIPAKAGIQKNA